MLRLSCNKTEFHRWTFTCVAFVHISSDHALLHIYGSPSDSYRSSRLGLSHWDPYAMHRGGCL